MAVSADVPCACLTPDSKSDTTRTRSWFAPRTECSSPLGTSQPRAEAAPEAAPEVHPELGTRFGALHSLGAFAELPNRIAKTGVRGEGRLPRGVRWPGRPAVRRGAGPRGQR